MMKRLIFRAYVDGTDSDSTGKYITVESCEIIHETAKQIRLKDGVINISKLGKCNKLGVVYDRSAREAVASLKEFYEQELAKLNQQVKSTEAILRAIDRKAKYI